MSKIIHTVIVVFLLFVPQMSVEAAGNQAFLNGKPFDYLDGEYVTQGELDEVNQAIEDTNTRIDDLEQPGFPETDLVFAGDFIGGFPARFSLKVDWANFKSSATGSFSSIEIKNSLGGSVKCSTPEVVDDIVDELHTHIPVLGSIMSFNCFEPESGRSIYWNVGYSGNVKGEGVVELNAGLKEAVNECGVGAVVRPLHPSKNWGGVGTDFGGSGGTCNAPSQALEVVLTR